jgi:transcriptional regulator with XRE-family HTH domain
MKTAQGILKNNLERCRQKRPSGPISKSRLAQRLGVNRSYITLLEKGQRRPSAAMLFRMSKELGCSVTELYEYADRQETS